MHIKIRLNQNLDEKGKALLGILFHKEQPFFLRWNHPQVVMHYINWNWYSKQNCFDTHYYLLLV